MQTASSKIWTRVTVFISYDDNHHESIHKLNIYGAAGSILPKSWSGFENVFVVIFFWNSRYEELSYTYLLEQVSLSWLK